MAKANKKQQQDIPSRLAAALVQALAQFQLLAEEGYLADAVVLVAACLQEAPANTLPCLEPFLPCLETVCFESPVWVRGLSVVC